MLTGSVAQGNSRTVQFVARDRKRRSIRLGKVTGCYVAVPPDPTEEEMEGIWATLRGLTQDAAGRK
jgi:hypothetical protein